MRKGVVMLALTILIGCDNGTQIEDLAITLSVGMDKEEKGVTVTTELLNIQKEGSSQTGGGSPKYFLESVTGKTISDAMTRQSGIHPKEVMPLHNKVLVFGEKMLQKGITDIISEFSLMGSIRGGAYIVAAKGTAHELLKSTAVEEQSISTSITKLVDRQGIQVKAVQFLQEASGKPQDIVITLLDTVESEGKKRLAVSGAAVLSHGKLKDYLDEEEMGLVALLNRQKSNVHVTVKYNGEPVEFSISHSKLKLVSRIMGARPKFSYEGNLIFNVYKSKLGAVVSPDDIARMEEMLSQKLNYKLTKLVHKVNTRYRSDVLGLADHLYRYRPSYWKKHNKDWDTILPDIDIAYRMKIHIKNVGLHI